MGEKSRYEREKTRNWKVKVKIFKLRHRKEIVRVCMHFSEPVSAVKICCLFDVYWCGISFELGFGDNVHFLYININKHLCYNGTVCMVHFRHDNGNQKVAF